MTFPHRDVPHHPRIYERTSPASALLRLYWMLFGNVALFMTAALMLEAPPSTFGRFDVAFGAVLLSLIGARFIDVTRCGGTRADGGPATSNDLRSYVVRLLLVAGAVWGAIHARALF